MPRGLLAAARRAAQLGEFGPFFVGGAGLPGAWHIPRTRSWCHWFLRGGPNDDDPIDAHPIACPFRHGGSGRRPRRGTTAPGAGRRTRRSSPGRRRSRASRTWRTGPACRPRGHHGRRRGQELRAGHRHDAPQSRSQRLADRAPHLQRMEPQPAEPDHKGQRARPADAMGLGDERVRGFGTESADPDRSQRHHVSPELRTRAAGPRCADGRSHLGTQSRHSLHDGAARPGDLSGQDLPCHQRRATGGDQRPQRRARVADADRGSGTGIPQYERPHRNQRKDPSGTRRLHEVPEGRRLLHQRLRRPDGQAALEVLHRGATGTSRR